MSKAPNLLGIVLILVSCYIFSLDRKKIRWGIVGWGLGLQVIFAIGILGIPSLGIPGVFRFIFDGLNSLVNSLISFSDAGADFVFGPLGRADSPGGFIFAFRALPTIIFFSSLTALLCHWGILQKVVKYIGIAMQRTLKSSGAESLSTAANIFLGQTEAPLLVRTYIAGMTRSEIFCVMVGGMATVAAGVMAAYVQLLQSRIPDIAGHLLTASVMAAPATIMISKLLIPEVGVPETQGGVKEDDSSIDANALEAAARGASEGLSLALNVAAMLVAFIALMAVADSILGFAGAHTGFAHWGNIIGAKPGEALSFSLLLGWISAPVAWLIGVPWSESAIVGRLLGEKVILNEFVAYVNLSKVANQLSDRTVIVTSYALCGFANFSSIGIQIGGIGTLAPSQRANLSRLGLLAVLGGSLACFLIAAIVGLLY